METRRLVVRSVLILLLAGIFRAQDVEIVYDPCIGQPTCDQMPRGRYPVPGDCTLYFSCSATGAVSIERCPNGQMYDYLRSTCNNRNYPVCLPACDVPPSTTTVSASTVSTLRTNTWGVTNTTETQTTTPSLSQEEQCAPSRDSCVPDELFGYVHSCIRVYQCFLSGPGLPYWRLMTCSNNQQFDVVSRMCVNDGQAVCETACPGFVRTTTVTSTTQPITTAATTSRPTTATATAATISTSRPTTTATAATTSRPTTTTATATAATTSTSRPTTTATAATTSRPTTTTTATAATTSTSRPTTTATAATTSRPTTTTTTATAATTSTSRPTTTTATAATARTATATTPTTSNPTTTGTLFSSTTTSTSIATPSTQSAKSTASTTRPTLLGDPCAPPEATCELGLGFGMASDCGRYYQCVNKTTNNGVYYKVSNCWSNQIFDAVRGLCVISADATCESSCPGYIRTTTTSTTQRTTIANNPPTTTTHGTQNTQGVQSTKSTQGIQSTVHIDTENTYPVTDTAVSQGIMTTLPGMSVSQNGLTTQALEQGSTIRSKGTTVEIQNTIEQGSTSTPKVTTDEIQRQIDFESCAPPQDVCNPDELFGYAGDCGVFYRCRAVTGSSDRYYEQGKCWNNQGFDVYQRRCIDVRQAVCETSCPGYVRTTTTQTTTTSRSPTSPPLTTETINDVSTQNINDMSSQNINDISTQNINGLSTQNINDITSFSTGDYTSDVTEMATPTSYYTDVATTNDYISVTSRTTAHDDHMTETEYTIQTTTDLETSSGFAYSEGTTLFDTHTSDAIDIYETSAPTAKYTTLQPTYETEYETLSFSSEDIISTQSYFTGESTDVYLSSATPIIVYSTVKETTHSVPVQSTIGDQTSDDNVLVQSTTILPDDISTTGSEINFSTDFQDEMTTQKQQADSTQFGHSTMSPTTAEMYFTETETHLFSTDMHSSTTVSDTSTDGTLDNTEGYTVTSFTTPEIDTTSLRNATAFVSDSLPTVDGSTTVTSPPPGSSVSPVFSTPCERREPCLPGSLLANPNDCAKYYECNPDDTWHSRACGNLNFDVNEEQCISGGMCAEPCQGSTTLPPTGSISDHVVTVLSDSAVEGQPLEAQCSFRVTPVGTPYTVYWYLNSSMLRNSSRIAISSDGRSYQQTDRHTSRVTFHPIVARDTGVLSCRVQLAGPDGDTADTSNKSLPITVLALPQSRLSPMSVVVEWGSRVTLTCTVWVPVTGHPGEGATLEVNWYRNGTQLDGLNGVEEIVNITGGSQLTAQPGFNTQYQCAGQNADVTQGEGARSSALVYVIAVNETVCAAQYVVGVNWTRTAVGTANVQTCPSNMIGKARRQCVENENREATWKNPTFVHCISEEFMQIAEKVSRLGEGVGTTADAERIAMEMENATGSADTLNPGDINSVVDSASTMGSYRRNTQAQNAELSRQEMSAMVTSVSNLLTDMNLVSWDSIREEYPDKAVLLMSTIDTYKTVFSYQMSVNDEDNLVSENLVVEADSVEKGQTSDLVYPDVTSWPEDVMADVITIEKDTLDQIGEVIHTDTLCVSAAYYKGLHRLLPAYQNYSEDAFLGSRVLALSVNGSQGQTLEPPIVMTFSHAPVPDDMVANCSFWDYSEHAWSTSGCVVVQSNAKETTCECSHLTNFAILVSRKPVEGTHAYVLGIISIVGCVISIAGLFLTILVYISIWKHVKSHHAVVLINLCIALLLANLLFVTGVDKTGNEDVCTAIAALLHYFYLAAFFNMLVEGVQLMLYIIYVFHVRRKRETAAMLFFAWFTPAAIVGICLGVTKTEGYGTEDYCWLDPDSGLFWAFLVPILIIIIINFGILIAVLRRISASKLHQVDKTRNQRIRSAGWNILVIMPILGVTWLFSVFSVNSDVIAFQYVFAIFNSLQGLFIFIFHAVCNKKVRDALTNSAPSSTSFSTSGIMSHLPGKKGNYSVKTNSKSSQRTQRSRLKSDSSGNKKAKKDIEAKKKRKQSAENYYDTIPAEYDMDTPPKDGMAVENDYAEPDEIRRPPNFHTSTFKPIPATSNGSTKPDVILNGAAKKPEPNGYGSFANQNGGDGVFRADSKYVSNGDAKKRTDSANSYMVPLSIKDMGVGFANPVFTEFGDGDLNINLSNHDTSPSYMDTSLSTKTNTTSQYNGGPKRLPRTEVTSSGTIYSEIPPRYHEQTPPPSLPTSFRREQVNRVDSLLSSNSGSSLQRREKGAMRPSEFIDMSLKASPRSTPKSTPKSSPYLPRSTPFLQKHVS